MSNIADRKVISMKRQSGLFLLYKWTIILAGCWCLWQLFPRLNFDQSGSLVVFIILGILAEWLAVSLPHGYLSGGYVVVLAAQLSFGGAATAWVTGLICIVGQGIANRGNPLRATLFNGGRNVLATTAAAWSFELVSGPVIRIVTFTLVYFLANRVLLYLYLWPNRRESPDLLGGDSLRWDAYSYLLTTPYGVLMANQYSQSGLVWAMMLFIPVLAAQIMLQKYVQMALANRELTALFQVAGRLTMSGESAAVFDQILQEARRVVNYHSGAIFFWSQERQLFLPAAASGPLQAALSNMVLAPEDGLVDRAVTTREPVNIGDLRETGLSVPGPLNRFRSLLVVPLLARGEVTGVLVLGDKPPYAYAEQHLPLLRSIGGQAGMVLANDLLADRIQYMAATDRLTDLLNHRQFYRLVVKELGRAAASGEPVSLLLVDIDNLRLINGRYGHGTGDALIRMVGSVLRDVTGPADTLARYGGGELAVLAPGVDMAAALKLADQIRVEVRDRRLIPEGSEQRVMTTVSIGVATFPEDTSDPDQLFLGAEKAAARAKELGRDRAIAFRQLVKQRKQLL